MGNLPKVSVLIPTYNYGHFLDEAIQSVLNQDYTDYEVIIVDNQSTDDTDKIVRKYLKDKRFNYFKNESNVGFVNNFNKCLDYARGEYIKFLCADNKFAPGILSACVNIMEQYPNVSLVTCNWEAFDSQSFKVERPFKYLHEGKAIINETFKAAYNIIGEPTCVMFRKSNLWVGRFRSDFPRKTDLEMWLRQLTAGDCYFIPETLAYIRMHESQLTSKFRKNFVRYFENYNFYKAVKENNDYNVDLINLNFDNLIKERALSCGRVMFNVIPALHKKECRTVFKKAFKIAYTEKVIYDALLAVMTRNK